MNREYFTTFCPSEGATQWALDHVLSTIGATNRLLFKHGGTERGHCPPAPLMGGPPVIVKFFWVQLSIPLLTQCCVHALFWYRHKDHLVTVRKTLCFGFKYLFLSKQTQLEIVQRAQISSGVTLKALSPVTPTLFPLPPDKKVR